MTKPLPFCNIKTCRFNGACLLSSPALRKVLSYAEKKELACRCLIEHQREQGKPCPRYAPAPWVKRYPPWYERGEEGVCGGGPSRQHH